MLRALWRAAERKQVADRQDRARWLAETADRQAAIVERLARDAREAADDVAACLYWLAAERQAARFVRSTSTHRRAPGHAKGANTPGAENDERLESVRAQARNHLAAATPLAVHTARSRLGLRLAFVGKGGVGKSLIAGTLARLLARRGRAVLAADLDTNPGLGFSLGVPPTAGVLPPEAVEPHPGAPYGWQLASGLAPAEAVRRHALEGPDGVRFVNHAKIDARHMRVPTQALSALREVVAGFGEPHWDVIGDLEAGPTRPFERYHAFADRVVIVVTPTWVSSMTERRLRPMVDDVPTLVVANQFGDEPDHPGMEALVRIPVDQEAAAAERRGVAPLDDCPDSPAVAAIARLADTLIDQELTV